MIAEKSPGLPPYGKPAINVPNPNAFSEGFVVAFTPSEGDRWIGNFRLGSKSICGIHEDFGERAVLIVAGGDVYSVDARAQRATLLASWATDVRFEPDLQIFLIIDNCDVTALGPSGVKWRSRRLAWDGITHVERHGMSLHGLAEDINDQPPVPFAIDLETGRATGGSYP